METREDGQEESKCWRREVRLCVWWSVGSLAVNVLLLFFLFVKISVEKWPFFNPTCPPSCSLLDWRTPKHLGLLLCTGPLLLLYTFSVDACTTYTANNIWELVILALRLLSLMLLKQLWFSASVVHLQPESLSLSLQCFIVFLWNIWPKCLFLWSALTPEENLPKDCLCLHSGLHSYLCSKLSKSVNYDINVHCSDQTPAPLCFILCCFKYFPPKYNETAF